MTIATPIEAIIVGGDTHSYRVAVSSVATLADALAPQYWDITVTFKSACTIATPVLVNPFPVLETTELGSQVRYRFPGATNYPVNEAECGPYTLEMIWPDKSKVSELLSLQNNGDLVVKSDKLGDMGSYSAQLKITLSDFPEANPLFVPLLLNVGRCFPLQLIPPEDQPSPIYYAIGGTPVIVQLYPFT